MISEEHATILPRNQTGKAGAKIECRRQEGRELTRPAAPSPATMGLRSGVDNIIRLDGLRGISGLGRRHQVLRSAESTLSQGEATTAMLWKARQLTDA